MRILIAGPSGSGKTTFAARLGRLLDIPAYGDGLAALGAGLDPAPQL